MEDRSKKLCEQLWFEYSDWLYRISRQMLSYHLHDVDDVVSNTYLAFCEALDSGKEIEYPKAWLYSTLWNFIKMKYSEFEREQENCTNLEDHEVCIFYEPDMVDEILQTRKEEEIIEYILDHLSERELQLYKCIYEEEMSMREVARLMGTTESAVKQLNYRTTKKLKKIIRDLNANI